MPKSTDTYNRSRYAILSYCLAFTTKKYYGENIKLPIEPDEAWHGGYTLKTDIPIDSLCLMHSAPESKYYLGWLKQTRDGHMGKEYLLKSIEDGSLCWWSNIGISYYPKASQFPSWKWSDKQFAFKDKWFRATKKDNDYLTIPMYPIFHEDGSVTLGTRPHAWAMAIDGENDHRPTKLFPNWKKVTIKEMQEFYQQAVNSTPNKN